MPSPPPARGHTADAEPAAGAQIEALSGDPSFMTSLARGLAVIQAFAPPLRSTTASQLSRKLGISRAAVRRCLYTLSQLGFAGSDDGRHFHLRPRVLTLGHSYMVSMPLAAAAHPVLDHLSRTLHESCSVATLDGADVLYVARSAVTRILAIDLGVGSRLPAFCTSMGRVLVAFLPAAEQEAYLDRLQWKRFTERTITTAERLRKVLRGVKRSGYSIVDQELEAGLRSLAVPIYNRHGQVVAALNVGAHAQRVPLQRMQGEFLAQLRAAARELSLLMP